MKRLLILGLLAQAIVTGFAAGAISDASTNAPSAESQTAKSPTEDKTHPELWAVIGLTLIVGAMSSYFLLWRKHQGTLSTYTKRNRAVCLISHIPDDSDSSSLQQILSGVALCMGVCLLLGAIITVIVKLFDGVNGYGSHGTALTAAGLVFGVLISIISFWTLSQTKRIERLQGAKIEGFKALTAEITKEINKINRSFTRHRNNASTYHRVFLVSTNPFFGQLSFFGDDEEKLFTTALDDTAKNAKMGFHMKILSGDKAQIKIFTEDFYKKSLPGFGDADRQQKVNESLTETESRIARLNNEAAKNVVVRCKEIPELQFAVIGNVVFEYILVKPAAGDVTGIIGARRIEDCLVCERFCKQLNLLERCIAV